MQVSPDAVLGGMEYEHGSELPESTAPARVAPQARWILCMATHTIEAATAKVPFSMILLLDHVRTKRAMPEEIRCRMIIPSDGLVSVSLWDTTNADVLKQWLDENLGSDTINQVTEVQEEFTFGCMLELARSRGADRMAGGGKKTLDAVAAGLSSATSRIQEWDRQTGVISQARETTTATVAKISDVVTKAAENEKVQTALRDTSVAFSMGWKKVSASLGWAGRKINAVAKEQGILRSSEGSGDMGATYQAPGGQLPHYNTSGGGGIGDGGPAAGANAAGGGGGLRYGESDDLDRQLSAGAFDPLDSPPAGYAPPAVAPAAGAAPAQHS